MNQVEEFKNQFYQNPF